MTVPSMQSMPVELANHSAESLELQVGREEGREGYLATLIS